MFSLSLGGGFYNDVIKKYMDDIFLYDYREHPYIKSYLSLGGFYDDVIKKYMDDIFLYDSSFL